MNLNDSFEYISNSLLSHKLRVILTLLGVSIGIFSVVILTSLVEGARIYVLQEFLELGSNLLIVIPGKVETSGALPWGGTTHNLTIENYIQLRNEHPEYKIGAPITVSSENVKYKNKFRSVAILGTTKEYAEIRYLKTAYGSFLPSKDPKDLSYVIVLGAKLSFEIFGAENPVGKIVKLGQTRFRVIGVLAKKGRMLGFDLDDLAFIPVKTSMKVFNISTLFRIALKVPYGSNIEEEKEKLIDFFKKVHRAEDVTVISQDTMLTAFSSVMNILSIVLGAIAAISLTVAGLSIMNLMLITVSERRQEIGILRACGAFKKQVLQLFLKEAIFLSSFGGFLGLLFGLMTLFFFNKIFPSFPAKPPLWAIISAIVLSISVGTLSGYFPAQKASKLDPILALKKK